MADGAQCVRILGLARFQTASHHLPDALLELPQQPLRYGVLRQREAPQSDALDVVVQLQRAHTAMVQEAQAQPRLQRPLAPLAVMVACHQALIGQREQATGELQRFAEVNLQRGEHVFIGDKPFVQIGVRKTGRWAPRSAARWLCCILIGIGAKCADPATPGNRRIFTQTRAALATVCLPFCFLVIATVGQSYFFHNYSPPPCSAP